MTAILKPVISTYYKCVEDTAGKLPLPLNRSSPESIGLESPRTQADPRVTDWLFLESPLSVVGIIGIYQYFVRILGPQMMKHREPFNLKYIMIAYNILQIILNGIIVSWVLKNIWLPRTYSLTCEPVDYSDNPLAVKVTEYAWLFLMIKIADLFDTVFMVLRKSGKQMSFLHLYHHSGMVFASWIGVRYFPGGHGVMVGTINSIVHMVMYSYYLVTAISPDYKKSIWWKRHITELQMVQFGILTIHASLALFNTKCTFPKPVILILMPQCIFMFFMFWDFYQRVYCREKPQKKIE